MHQKYVCIYMYIYCTRIIWHFWVLNRIIWRKIHVTEVVDLCILVYWTDCQFNRCTCSIIHYINLIEDYKRIFSGLKLKGKSNNTLTFINPILWLLLIFWTLPLLMLSKRRWPFSVKVEARWLHISRMSKYNYV